MRRAVLGVSIMAVGAASACSAGDPFTGCGSGDAATSASDVIAVTNVEGALYFAVADAIPDGLFAAQGDQAPSAAEQVVAASATSFPGGCATATASSGTVTFALFDCSGPLGLVHATGTVTAKIVDEGSGPGAEFLLQLSGDSVSASGAVLTLDTSAFLTEAPGGERTLHATSMTSGTGPSGTSVDHTGSFTMTWSSGAACATLDGSFAGVGSGTYGGASETLTGYVVCRGGCPRSGVAMSVFGQGSVSLAYDGSPYAFCTASSGTSEALSLECASSP